ncbi:CatB-related O-acetyltransferase [Algoriphagus formosus]|uniref:CatB-related O-acetyltransferase n=1 Tax=Algoriphagus formosus TaxID=2007308 RepID=A0A4V3AQM6_9BACT|nr:CatB-related O-acetyltransferase [Algoriphagus aquimaris]TDK43317.1 CatB-related O-acetyltransferase [Algoriphagus aquimaris]
MFKWINKLVRIKAKKDRNSIYTKDSVSKKNCFFGDYTYGIPEILEWGEGATLTIGKFCSIAENVTIFLGGNHRIDWISTYPFNVLNNDFERAAKNVGHPATKGDVVIGNDVWIGRGAVILSGITIGDGAVIGANSVITKNIPAYEVYAGNPAKFIKKRFNDEEIDFLKELRWWDFSVSRINDIVDILQSSELSELKEMVK